MPDPAPSNIESLWLLRDFLSQVEKILAAVAYNPGPVIRSRHHDKLRAAWDDVRPKFSLAISSLQEPSASNITERLAEVGLTGPQLVFKLSIFRQAHDELTDHGMPAAEEKPKKMRWWERWVSLLKPTLKAANVILGSLAKVLPPVEAIKEFKEAVEAAVNLGRAVPK